MTNKALIDRPAPKWQIVTAFAAATTLHLSAIAIASLRPEVARAPWDPNFPEIDVEPGEPTTREPEVETVPPIPVPVTPPDSLFPDTEAPPRQPLKKPPVAPIRARQFATEGMVPLSNARNNLLRAPRPEYPYEARSRRVTGSGLAIMAVDPSTGAVTGVTMVQSTGNQILDNSAISAFRRWRFKTGTAPKVRVPITFTLTGAQY
jgi:TonB family protein